MFINIKYLFRRSPEDNPGEEVKEPTTANEYIEAIKKLKKTTVPLEQYETLKEEKAELIDAILNQNPVTNKQEQPTVNYKERAKELRNGLFKENNNLTNLAYAQKTIELRKLILENENVDIFVPTGRKIRPTDEDIKKANEVAEYLEHCIEVADGNPGVFDTEFQRNLN